jgi:hypothetical protein
LSRISNYEAIFLGKLVHTCPDCEVIGVLSAAVEHNNQRKLPTVQMVWNVELVVS